MYFVTLCANQGHNIFGMARNGLIVLNACGTTAEKWWRKLTHKFPTIRLDEYVVMPNHLHGIIDIVGSGFHAGPRIHDHVQSTTGGHGSPPLHNISTNHATVGAGFHAGPQLHNHSQSTTGGRGSPPLRVDLYPSIQKIMQWFKSISTYEYTHSLHNSEKNKLWQRGYYDRIIRNEHELKNIREYIRNNPLKWELDEYYKSP